MAQRGRMGGGARTVNDDIISVEVRVQIMLLNDSDEVGSVAYKEQWP